MLEGCNVIVFPKAWVANMLEPEIAYRLEELSYRDEAWGAPAVQSTITSFKSIK
jgi:hypothetical protein